MPEAGRGQVSSDTRIDVAGLSASLAADETGPLRRHFVANRAAPPTITWSPSFTDLGTPLLESFADICDGLATPEGFLEAGRFRLEDFDGLDRWMMVLSGDGEHYRYDHYGREIANHYGIDMTGWSTADFDNYIGLFYAALYTAARTRRERILSVHEPPMRIFVRYWRRLIVPMVDPAGDITGFAVANIPDNELRSGLEMIVDPVFVTDGSGLVQYYNEAARSYFSIASSERRPISALSGLDIADMPPPEVLLARRETIERIELVERRAGMMERLAVSVSAAEHRGRAYYVLLLRAVAPG